ncbi:uncharacterized protein [Anolis sagrei]|uniref:uncharacterized protein n=1 Tax=Anolis sagrei TaxID=38937 RepID=UPI003521EB9F
MAPKKNLGGPKGKGPAAKTATKRPSPTTVSSSEEEGISAEDLNALLIRVNQLEKERGVAAPAGPRPARHASKTAMFKALLSRVSTLESGRASRPIETTGPSSTATGECSAASSQPSELRALPSERTPQGQGFQGPSAVDALVRPPAQLSVASTSTDGPLLGRRRRVLICGHSYVHWAERHARRSTYGQHLGLASTASIEWRGRRGLRWDGLIPLMFQAGGGPPPDVLVIHLGGNDLGLLQGKALYLQARSDFKAIAKAWPNTLIAWSAMIPRLRWIGGGDIRQMERARKRVNRAIRIELARRRGLFIHQGGITLDNLLLYRGDGIHLSDEGNDIFLANLKFGIERALMGLVG